MPLHRVRSAGFSLIELMVTIAIIAIMMALAMPSIGTSITSARERSVEQKLIQDFTWARGAAGAGDAGSLITGQTGSPTIEFKIDAVGTWTTRIKTPTNSAGVVDVTHSMSSLQLSSLATIACVATSPLTMSVTFTFTPQGYVNNSGTVTCTGNSGQRFPMNFIYSGSVFRTYGSTS